MIRRFMPLAALVLTCGIAAPASAQGFFGAAGGLSPMRLTPSLQTKLSITAEQKSKLEGIQMKLIQDIRAAFQGGGQGAALELATKAETEALGVLTADQKKTFETWKKDVEPYQGLGRTHIAILAVTGLNDDQKKQLKDLAGPLQTKRIAAFRDAQGGNFQDLRDTMQQLEADAQAGVKKILNPDQQKQWETEAATIPMFGRRQAQ